LAQTNRFYTSVSNNKLRLISFATVVTWLSYWLTKTRYALLDDALIHLRYADYLYRYHAITFDGIHHSFGTSSLLYVSLLGVLRSFSASPLIPKFASDLSYIALVGLVFVLVVRVKQRTLSQLVLTELLVCILSPMGVRWLTDGMETSLTDLLIVVLAIVVKAEQSSNSQSRMRYMVLVAFGAVLVCLRIELALIIALCGIAVLLVKSTNEKDLGAATLQASPIPIGAVLAMISIRIAMGSFLPDTALAKSGQMSLQPVIASLHVLGSSLLFGIGCSICWAQSAFLALHRACHLKGSRNRIIAAVVLENIAIFVVISLSCLRGQSIQGVRYIIWPLIFGIVANALYLARCDPKQPGAESLNRAGMPLAMAFLVLFLCALPYDWCWASRAMQGRSQTFLDMRNAHFGRMFAQKTIVASDVGFISYFTDSQTCDLAGLVNGKTMARMAPEQRMTHCMQQSPAMLFLSSSQIHDIEGYLHMGEWSVCGVYDFTNVRGNDRHYLIVPSEAALSICSQLNSFPRSLATSNPTIE